MSLHEHDQANEGGAGLRIPLLRPDGSTPYAVWRPQILTYMMRVGIEDRYYAEPIAAWDAVVAAVGAVAATDERAAMQRLVSAPCTITKDEPMDSSSSGKGLDKAIEATKVSEKEDRKLLARVVAQSRKAFGILYAAIDTDVRALIGGIAQGYAFGLWALLEERYQSQKDDNIADVWARFIALTQDPNEAYDSYMARVDKDLELLKAAKQEVPSGLRKIVLLYHLQPLYAPARLALQTSKRIEQSDTIDWAYVKSFMLDYEREQNRTDPANEGIGRALAARAQSGPQRQPPPQSQGYGANNGSSDRAPRDMSAVDCYHCGKLGHTARYCKKRKKEEQSKGAQSGGPGRYSNKGGGGSSGSDDEARHETTNCVVDNFLFTIMTPNRFRSLPDSDIDSSDDESGSDDGPERTYAAAAKKGAKKNDAPKAAVPTTRRLKNGNGELIPRPAPAPIMTDAERKASAVAAATDAGKKAEREKKLREAVMAENKEGLELRRETMERNKNRGANAIDKALREYAWGVDSMASLSVTGNRSLLTNVRKCEPVVVKVADGKTITVMHKGDTKLHLKVLGEQRTVGITVPDVHWHATFDANLLSWGVMRTEGWTMTSTKDGTRITTPKGTKLAASTQGRLTILETALKPERVYAARLLGAGRVTCTSADDLVRLHERLGHVSYKRLIKMCQAGRTDGIGSMERTSTAMMSEAKKRIIECTACLKGKMSRPEFGSRGLDKGSHPGDVLHVDTAYVKLPADGLGRKGVKYWLIATDPYSEGRFTAVTDTKSEIASALIGIMTRLHAMTGKRLRLLYCDNGTELVNTTVRDYCNAHGTQLQSPPAHTPELRGVAERAVRSFKDGARTMLAHCDADQPAFWSYAAKYQAYLWNRTRIAKATYCTPLESLGGRTPSVAHTGVFGCDAWVQQGKTERNTFDAKALPAIYLGHDDSQHGALAYVFALGKVIRTRDIQLREDSFNHMRAYRTGGSSESISIPRSDSESSFPPAPSVAPAAQQKSDDEDYEVERVLRKRASPGGTQYLIQWVGYETPTWVPESNLGDAPDALDAYEKGVRETTPASRPDPASEPAPAPAALAPPARRGRSAARAALNESDDESVDGPIGSNPAAMSVLYALTSCSRL
jgi:Chromo (CHRromatin Organisation MOdifier) domain/gag-polypeptide of LTR copia-type